LPDVAFQEKNMSKKKVYPVTVAFRLMEGDSQKLEKLTEKMELSKSEFLRRYLITNVLNFNVK